MSRMPRRQRGGALEPILNVPPFHYTQSEGRKAWTSALYPYAPYFLHMFKKIPWAEYTYEDDEVKVRSDKDLPYVIGGGAALEISDAILGNRLPVRLHEFVDPTGDIEAYILKPLVQFKEAKNGEDKDPFISGSTELKAWAKNYTTWLFSNVVRYFELLSYSFEEWFGETLTEFDIAKINSNSSKIHLESIRHVGPFTIFSRNVPYDDGKPSYRIIVTTAAVYGKDQHYHNYFMELSVFYLNTFGIGYSKKDNLFIESIFDQIYRNYHSIKNKIDYFKDEGGISSFYNILNHLNRKIFLLNELTILPEGATKNYADELKVCIDTYKNSIQILADIAVKKKGMVQHYSQWNTHPRDKKRFLPKFKEEYRQIAKVYIDMILYFPEEFRDDDYESIVEKAKKDLEAEILTLSKVKNLQDGGSSKRKKTRRRRRS